MFFWLRKKRCAKVVTDNVRNHGYCVAILGHNGWPKMNPIQIAELQALLPANLTGIAWTVNAKVIAVVYSFNTLMAWNIYVDVVRCYLEDAVEWERFRNEEAIINLRQTIELSEGIILPPIPDWEPIEV
jgi:hypothetical protein